MAIATVDPNSGKTVRTFQPHTDAQVDHLVQSLTELWQACPLAKGHTVRLAAE